jgi:hypothetical protein
MGRKEKEGTDRRARTRRDQFISGRTARRQTKLIPGSAVVLLSTVVSGCPVCKCYSYSRRQPGACLSEPVPYPSFVKTKTIHVRIHALTTPTPLPYSTTPRATTRVRRGNEPRAPRLPPCACPGFPRTGHAPAVPHAASAHADPCRYPRLAVARRLIELRCQSVYHLTKSLEEREQGGTSDFSNERGQALKRRTYCHRVEDSSSWHSPMLAERSLARAEGGYR